MAMPVDEIVRILLRDLDTPDAAIAYADRIAAADGQDSATYAAAAAQIRRMKEFARA